MLCTAYFSQEEILRRPFDKFFLNIHYYIQYFYCRSIFRFIHILSNDDFTSFLPLSIECLKETLVMNAAVASSAVKDTKPYFEKFDTQIFFSAGILDEICLRYILKMSRTTLKLLTEKHVVKVSQVDIQIYSKPQKS